MINSTWLANEFHIWLIANRHKFTFVPILVRNSKSGTEYKFKNVTSRLKLWIDKTQFMITFGKYDILVDFDVILDKSKKGKYFCRLCKTPRKYYSNPLLLIERHCFLPLVEWINSNLKVQNVAIVTGKLNSWSAVKLLNKSAAKRNKSDKHFRFCYQLVLNNIKGGKYKKA